VDCGAAGTCADGACQCAPVAGEIGLCDNQCIDLSSDSEHCGDCGTVCGDAAPYCVDGECSECAMCGDACFDLQLSEQHCGTCERACTAGQQCIDGVCRSGSCERDCPDGTPVCCGDGDGFCTSLETDVEDCGACGVHCGGEVVCVAGHCL
jgi:hypothetical protein